MAFYEKNKQVFIILAALILLLTACSTSNGGMDGDDMARSSSQISQETEQEVPVKDEKKAEMKLKIGDAEVPVTWEENDSVNALASMIEEAPLEIQMSMYGGFEQVGPIGQSILSDDQQTTTQAGDIVLYSGDQIVIFYGSNSWAYTRLGHVDLSQEEMEELLGNGDVMLSILK